jgi:putative replication protein
MGAFEALKKLQAIMPEGVKPKFSSAEEWRAWQDEQGRIASAEVADQNRAARVKSIIGRSGIQELHMDCSFDNFVVSNENQAKALRRAKSWLNNSSENFGGFIFSGSCGTGKNHLAAAIGNRLVEMGRSILVITVPDMMMKFRDSYQKGSPVTETQLMDIFCKVDLLVLDDVGVQHGKTNESVLLFQIIDRRASSRKATSILTNLNDKQLTEALTERIVDRLRMGGGIWVNFDWESYRKNVK